MPITIQQLAARYQAMELFHDLPASVLLELAQKSDLLQLLPGEPVFKKNDPGDALFLLLSGEAKVHDDSYTVSMLQSGSCFGELALLDAGPRSMSISATESSLLARIDREIFFEVVSDYPGFMQQVVGLLVRRLRIQTDQTVGYLRQRENELTALVEQRTAELIRQKEQAEAEKREAEFQRRRAEQSEKFEQQFLANMSHEIRTPMNAVMGMTRLLLQKGPREDQLKYLRSILQSSEALLVIINDILDISKIQAGRLELEWTDLDLRQVFENIRSTLQFRADEKGLAFSVECDDAIPQVLHGDPVRLQQILLNLAGNAVKFTEKGQVNVRAELLNEADGRAEIIIKVEDSGIGMNAEQVQTVFESFKQASIDITRKYGGTGLGLSISKQLIELFGGTLKVESELGKGSVFQVWLNLEIGKESPKSSSVLPETNLEELRALRILLAEDNEFNRIVAVETLEILIPEVRITTAENGLEAYEHAQSGTFDVILMDVSMPEMDGLEASRLIRALPAPAGNMPIIAFTASVTSAEISRCYDAGMNACIPKPFKEQELISGIVQVLNKGVVKPLNLDGLFELSGKKPERMAKYLGLFLESAQMAIEKIETALSQRDHQTLHRAIHTLKPQLKLIGENQTASFAQELEEALVSGGNSDELMQKIQSFSLQVADAKMHVKTALEKIQHT